MKKTLLAVLLSLPPLFLVSVVIWRKAAPERRDASVWFAEMQMGRPSPALDALKKMGEAAVPALVEELNSTQRHRQFRAAWALGQIGPAASNAVPHLIEALDDPEISVRIHCMEALTSIGTTRDSIVPKLLAALNDPTLASYAAELLARIAQDRAAQGLPEITGNINTRWHSLNHLSRPSG